MICPVAKCGQDRGAANPCARHNCPFRTDPRRLKDTERIQMGEYLKRKYPLLGDEK